MMVHPEGQAAFFEIPKTGSTSATVHLNRNKWFQNGAKGTNRIPGTSFIGRHGLPSIETRRIFDEANVTAYCVVRNAWDRMASAWRAHCSGAGTTTTLYQYLTKGKFIHGDIDIFMTQQRRWSEHADVVMRYEDLDNQWEWWADVYRDLPPGPLPRKNVSKFRGRPEWDQKTIDLVALRFAEDIEHFGWTGPT